MDETKRKEVFEKIAREYAAMVVERAENGHYSDEDEIAAEIEEVIAQAIAAIKNEQ